MNRVVWVGLALFLLAMIGAPHARADSYKPAVTSEGGSFHSMAAFRDMAFDVTAEGGRHSAHRIARWDHRAEAGGNAGDNDNQGNDNDQGSMGTGSMGTTPGTNAGSGMGSCGCSSSTPPTTTAATAATPEPGTVVLMLFGIGLLFLTRKRFLPSVRNT